VGGKLLDQQTTSRKSDVPWYYLAPVTSDGWLSNQGQTLAHFNDHFKVEDAKHS
jgi:hypothetical protein